MFKSIIFLIAIVLVSLVYFIGKANKAEAASAIERISASQAKDLIDENSKKEDFRIIDIRTPSEYNSGHIENAIMIDFYASDFAQKIESLDRDMTYLVYCRSGNRSGQSLKLFEELQFKKVYELKNGIISWQQSSYKFTD